MGTKLSKSNKGEKKEDFIANGRSWPDSFDKTSTLPASFRRKGHEVSKTGSLPRNSGTLPRQLDRSTSFSKRFRKSCRNWAAQRGLVSGVNSQSKKENLGDDTEVPVETVVTSEQIEDKSTTDKVQEVPEVVVTEPQKEMDLGAIVATLVVEAHKKKMASRAQSRAQSREALLDKTEESPCEKNIAEKSLQVADNKQSEHDNDETQEALPPKVDFEVSDSKSEIVKEDISDYEKEPVKEARSAKSESDSNDELIVDQFIPDQANTSAEEESASMTHQEISEDDQIKKNEVDNTSQIELECGSEAPRNLGVETSAALEILNKDSLKEEIMVNITPIEETNVIEENALEDTASKISNDENIDAEVSFKNCAVNEILSQETTSKDVKETEENKVEQINSDEGVQQNTVTDEMIAAADTNEYEENTQQDMIEKTSYENETHIGDEIEQREPNGDVEIKQTFSIDKESAMNSNEHLEALSEDINVNTHTENGFYAKQQALDEILSEESDSQKETEPNSRDEVEKPMTHSECTECQSDETADEEDKISSLELHDETLLKDVTMQEVASEEITEEEDPNETDECTENIIASDSSSKVELCTDSTDEDLDVIKTDSDLECENADALMDQIINDIVEQVTDVCRDANDRSECESPCDSLESDSALSSDDKVIESEEEVIEKHKSIDSVSLPGENECATDKLER